jgi:hypothetical protein
MKNRFALLIVVSSALGLSFVLINTMFIEEVSNRLLNGLALFKFFTIQSNLIVMMYFIMYLTSNFKNNETFKKVFGGVVIYITITFIVFLIFLEPIYNPKGFALVGSLFNHYITPLLVLGFLFKFKDDYTFSFSDTKTWIVYPIIYLLFLFSYGLITNNFIYPFFQVNEVGIIGIIASILVLVILFVLMSFSLVKIVSKK